MISRISAIRCSHAAAIPSDEGRVYSLVRRAPIQGIGSVRDSYREFENEKSRQTGLIAEKNRDFLEGPALGKHKDLASNKSLYGYGIAFFAASLHDASPVKAQPLIIRA